MGEVSMKMPIEGRDFFVKLDANVRAASVITIKKRITIPEALRQTVKYFKLNNDEYTKLVKFITNEAQNV